jgi:murein DD-endopeptidase MepM/ murein hydrolase activator NlpD
MKLGTIAGIGWAALLLSGCAAGERHASPRPTAVRSERDVYAASVRVDPMRLRAWEDASRRALRSGVEITPSYRERIALPSDEAYAVAYSVMMVRGQRLRVSVAAADGAAVFTDMFHHVGSDIFRPVHWERQSSGGGTFVARTDGEYVLRVQPPIGAGGVFDVAVLGGGSLVFPVAGASVASIGSVFGDPRDNGARAHEGVDIFAPRGTTVVAVTDGTVRQSRNTPTGGLVIWQSDAASSLTYYYAHLDELLVREGAYVRAGDPIGRVGNTGNARAARPHLHFAIYRPGTIALDPMPLLAARAETDAAAPISGRSLGTRTRVSSDGVRLRRSPSLAGAVITELSTDTPLLVLGDTGDWQRVALPDGTTGFVASHLTGSDTR